MFNGNDKLRVTYSVVEAVIAGLHSVDVQQMSALRGRMKYFQRLGFPVGRPKRGTRTGYLVEDLLQVAVAFEMLSCGAAPVRAVRAARTNWEFNRSAFARAANGGRSFLAMEPQALVELVDPPSDVGEPIADPFGKLGAQDIAEWAQEGFDERKATTERTLLVIDVGRLLAALSRQLAMHGIDASHFRSDVAALR